MRLKIVFGISILLFNFNLKAQIEFFDIDNIILTEESVFLDINDDSFNDFQIHYFYETDPNGYAIGYNVIPLDSNAVLSHGHGSIVENNLNDTIHENLEDWMMQFPGPSYWIRRFVSYDNSLNIRTNEFDELFMGIRLKIDQNYHYGWIQLSGQENANNITIESYAFNHTPDDHAIISESLFTGINEQNPNKTLFVFPNPASTTFTIKFENNEITQVEIFDLNGKLVSKRKFINVATHSTEILKSGLYLLKVTNKETFISTKILIEK